MSRNAISANPERYIFKIFWGSMLPDPPTNSKIKLFSRPLGSKFFFRIDFPPKQKVLDRTQPWMVAAKISSIIPSDLSPTVQLSQTTVVKADSHVSGNRIRPNRKQTFVIDDYFLLEEHQWRIIPRRNPSVP